MDWKAAIKATLVMAGTAGFIALVFTYPMVLPILAGITALIFCWYVWYIDFSKGSDDRPC